MTWLTLKEQQEQYDRVKDGSSEGTETALTNTANEAMKYGVENELNAVGTLASKLLPVLAPSASLHKEGYYKIPTANISNFLTVSPLIFVQCCACFGIKNTNVHVCTRFDQIHQLFHKILSINIILKSIKGHNSVEKFRKVICISHNMDHIYQCINKVFSKSIHYF